MTVSVVLLPVDMGLVAHVFRGDEEDPNRIWVCVRSKNAPPKPGWLGCWSKKVVSGSSEVKDFLRDLQREVLAKARVGPRGPWLGGIYFFSGWDAWGPGMPSPLMGVSSDEIALADSSEVSIAEFNFELPGL